MKDQYTNGYRNTPLCEIIETVQQALGMPEELGILAVLFPDAESVPLKLTSAWRVKEDFVHLPSA